MKTFINVEQMKLATLQAGQFVETGGYYAKGDAGAARYLIVAAQAFDGYGDHELANGTVAVLQISGAANVRQFGAVGDGVTDDTTPIQEALDSSAYLIVIPGASDKYKITDELTVSDGKKVSGHGWKSKVSQSTQNKSVFVAGDNNEFKGLHPQVIDGDNSVFTNCFKFTSSTTGLVERCYMKSADVGCCGVFVQNSKQITIKYNLIYGGLWDGSTANAAATSADILLYSGAASSRHIIQGNMCFSNNSQGIFVDALGYDADTLVSGNICITLDTTTCVEGGTWAEAATGGVRRHGIMVGYNDSSVLGTRVIVSDNIIKNTRWTGIYKQGVAYGVISITDNICTYTGYQTSNSLSAGIFVNLSGNEKISGNSIDEFQNTDAQGVGGIVLNSAIENTESVLISDNKISNSASHGVYITTRASHAVVEGNHIIEPALSGIGIVNTVGGGHVIKSNFISKSSGLLPGIDYSKQGATISSIVKNNTIEGFDNTTVDTANAGIRTAGDTTGLLRVETNIIKGFYYGYTNGSYWSGRATAAVFARNTIEDCNTGFNISAVSNLVTVPLVDNTFINVTTKSAGSLGGAAGRVVQQEGDRYVWESSAAPTVGSWIVGDRSMNTVPASAGSIGWVCTVTGAPGTWNAYGTIA